MGDFALTQADDPERTKLGWGVVKWIDPLPAALTRDSTLALAVPVSGALIGGLQAAWRSNAP